MSDNNDLNEARLENSNCGYGKFWFFNMSTFLLGWLVGSHLLEQIVTKLVGSVH